MGYVASFIKFDGEVIGTHRNEPPLSAEEFADITHILISIPPDEDGDIVLKTYTQNIIDAPLLKWVGYLSTTGVYGDHNGEWVDEDTPPTPKSQRSKNRLLAENQWLDLFKQHGVSVNIFRLAGIYGPGRSSFDRMDKQRIDKPGHYFSRIHVEDIAQVLQKSMFNKDRGELYCLADDEPCESRKVIEYACDLKGLPYPPLVKFEDAQLSEMAQDFYRENKRVSNHKIKNKLGIKLKHTSYKDGLKSIYNYFLGDFAKK